MNIGQGECQNKRHYRGGGREGHYIVIKESTHKEDKYPKYYDLVLELQKT